MVQAQASPNSFKVRAPDGLLVSAQEWGNPAGAEIVLIHGFSQSHLSWARQFESALADSLRIVTYDIRGHGESEKPLDPIYYRHPRRWAGELRAVLQSAKLKKPVLVGWSYGGRVIAEYLAEYGDGDLAGINFVAAFTKLARDVMGPASRTVVKMSEENLAENIANTLAFLRASTARPLTDDELRWMLAYNMVVPPRVRAHLLGRPADYERALRRIEVPVLVTHGTEDRVALVAMAHYTASVVPRARLSLYEGVGHMPFWEAAPRFNRELAEFVARANKGR